MLLSNIPEGVPFLGQLGKFASLQDFSFRSCNHSYASNII